MLRVVAPVDHRYPELTLDVRVTLPPAQKVVTPEAVIVGVAGMGLTVTVVAREAGLRQAYEFVTCTVKLPVVFTEILCENSPFDQR